MIIDFLKAKINYCNGFLSYFTYIQYLYSFLKIVFYFFIFIYLFTTPIRELGLV